MNGEVKQNVVKIPITQTKLYRNRLGRLAVPCEVTERWLQFEESSSRVTGGEFLSLDVMTRNADGDPKKVCGLVIERGELLKALSHIKPGADCDQ